MSSGDFTWGDFQRMENGAPPAPLVFTGSYMEEAFGPNGPDEDDIAAMDLAMERDMRDREHYYAERCQDLEEENAALRAELEARYGE